MTEKREGTLRLKEEALKTFLGPIKMLPMNQVQNPFYFSQLIGKAIEIGGLTPGDVAELAGVSLVSVMRWKDDARRVPKLVMRKAVCRHLEAVFEKAYREKRPVQEVVAERIAELYGRS